MATPRYTPELEQPVPPKLGRPPRRKADGVEILGKLLDHGIRDTKTLAVLLNLSPRGVRWLRELVEPHKRRRMHNAIQAARWLAENDPQLLAQVHRYHCGRELQATPERSEDHLAPMVLCAACVAAMRVGHGELRKADRLRWTRQLQLTSQAKQGLSHAQPGR